MLPMLSLICLYDGHSLLTFCNLFCHFLKINDNRDNDVDNNDNTLTVTLCYSENS